MKNLITKGCTISCIVLLSACTTAPITTGGPGERSQSGKSMGGHGSEMVRIDTGNSSTPREEIIERGSGVFINDSRQPGSSASENTNGIDLNFDGSPLKEFISAVLGDLLHLNYIINPAVSGSVTLHTSAKIDQSSLLPLVEQILTMNGVGMDFTNGFYQIRPAASAQPGTISPSTGNSVITAGQTIQIIPLKYISGQEMKKLLKPVVTDINKISIDETRNLVIASGNANEIKAIRDTIDIFDVDWLKGMSIGLFPLDHVSPEALSTELGSVLNTNTNSTSTSTSNTKDSKNVLDGLVRLVPLERLQSLLVVSSSSTALREVETWIRRLDQPTKSNDKKLFVYRAQNSKATELADTLGHILEAAHNNQQAGKNRSAGGSESSVAPGLASVKISNKPTDSANTPTASQSSLTNIDDVQVIADDVRNSLVILANDHDYAMIGSALRELDVIPLQVMIEASIIEVTLRDDLSFGVEWFFRNRLDSNKFRGVGTLDLGSSGISALAPGFSYTVMDSADQVRLALNTLASESEVHVLSSPSLMVLDNKTAMINVGDEIPVPTRQSISNIDPTSPTVNEITFRQTGITLTVTPRVNNSGLVTLDISQEVSSAATTTTSKLDAPTIQKRKIQSVVAILSGETIMLGGLMLEQKSTGGSGVPGLRKIPLLGHLFSQNTNENSRKELLVLITPKVVKSQIDAKSITDEYRSKLKILPPITNPQKNPGS